MKLLQIICIEEYAKEVREILRHSGVRAFSYFKVHGYKPKEVGSSSSWFASDHPATDSVLFLVYILEDCLEEIFQRVEDFNQKVTALSKIHVACMAVEKSNF